MDKLNRKDLWVLEEYAEARATFQPRVLAHRLERELLLGPVLRLLFHDRLTTQYELQEALYHDRVFEREIVQRALAVHNQRIPDGHNWKATCRVDLDGATAVQDWHHRHPGVERQIWVQVEGAEPVYADRVPMPAELSLPGHSAAVLSFSLTAEMRAALMAGAELGAGVSHPLYACQLDVPETTRLALLRDLSPI